MRCVRALQRAPRRQQNSTIRDLPRGTKCCASGQPLGSFVHGSRCQCNTCDAEPKTKPSGRQIGRVLRCISTHHAPSGEHTHTHTHTHTNTLTHTHTLAHTHECVHTHTHTHRHTHAQTHSLTHTLTHRHRHKHKHTHTHTHTHTPYLVVAHGLWNLLRIQGPLREFAFVCKNKNTLLSFLNCARTRRKLSAHITTGI